MPVARVAMGVSFVGWCLYFAMIQLCCYREQLALKRQLVTQDCPLVKWILRMLTNKDTSKTFYIGGVDISFIKGNSVDACAALIIISFPELKVSC